MNSAAGRAIHRCIATASPITTPWRSGRTSRRDARKQRQCLMCSEREPLDCHRCLLVARALAARGVTMGHILHGGGIESHAATERRLLDLAGEDSDLFATGQNERLAAAYRRRARAVAFRLKSSTKTTAALDKRANQRATADNKSR